MLAVAIAFIVLAWTPAAQNSKSADNAEAQLSEAASQYRQGKFAESESIYQNVWRSSPNSVEALAGMGKCRILLGRSREAIAPLSEALKRQPDDREITRDLAHAFVDLNQFQPAEQLLSRLVKANSQDKESWYYFGVLMYKNGYYGAALDYLEWSLDANADVTRQRQIAIYRAVSLEKTGRTREAETAMNRLAANPAAQSDPDFMLTFAELLYETDRPLMALEKADQALRARPDLAMGYFWRAKVLFRLGRLEDAAMAAEQSVRLLPRLPFPRYLLVKIYQAQGRSEEARRQAVWLQEYEDRNSAAER